MDASKNSSPGSKKGLSGRWRYRNDTFPSLMKAAFRTFDGIHSITVKSMRLKAVIDDTNQLQAPIMEPGRCRSHDLTRFMVGCGYSRIVEAMPVLVSIHPEF
jgi:hypothetical protein